MNEQQANPGWWPDDEPDNAPRYASWQVLFADGDWQRIAAWPPLTRSEVLAAYRCLDAVKAN